MAVHAVLQAGLVYAWVSIVPTLIRPVYTWLGYPPPLQAMLPLQTSGYLLVTLAFVLGAVRLVVEHRGLSAPLIEVRQIVLHRLRQRVVRARTPLPKAIGIGVQTLVMSLLLAGLVGSWTEALLLAAGLATLLVVRERLGLIQPQWLVVIGRLPLALRFVLCAYVCTYVAALVVGKMWWTDTGFQSMWISVLVSLLIFAVIIPGTSPLVRERL
jgi:hypothetical protein